MIKLLELFGGIGACSKALKRLNIPLEVVDYVEIDKYAVQSYNAINDTNFEPQDITQWDKDIEVDMIMHGSPCQDFSLAGRQAGGDEASGTRSSLMYETIRIVEKLNPRYVVWENVKNLLSEKHKHNFDNYISVLDELGYNSYYQVLNAKDYGIPQNRERVFTVSIRKDVDDGKFEFPQKQELTLRLKDMLADDVDEKYYLSKTLNMKLTKNYIQWDNSGKGYNSQAARAYYLDSFAPTLSHCNGNGDKSQIVECEKKECLDIQNRNIPRCLNSKGGRGGIEGLQPSLQDRIYDSNAIATAVTTSFMPSYTDKLRIRKLTPLECWRLMGFDDEDFYKAESVCSNNQLYKQAGNSIVVNILESVFKSLHGGTIK